MLHARTNSLRHFAIGRAATLLCNKNVPPWSRYCCFPTKSAKPCHSFPLFGVQCTARRTQHCERTLLLHSLLEDLKAPGPDQPYSFCLTGLHTRCFSHIPHLAGILISFFNLTALRSVLVTHRVFHTHAQVLHAYSFPHSTLLLHDSKRSLSGSRQCAAELQTPHSYLFY